MIKASPRYPGALLSYQPNVARSFLRASGLPHTTLRLFHVYKSHQSVTCHHMAPPDKPLHRFACAVTLTEHLHSGPMAALHALFPHPGSSLPTAHW